MTNTRTGPSTAGSEGAGRALLSRAERATLGRTPAQPQDQLSRQAVGSEATLPDTNEGTAQNLSTHGKG